MNKKKTPIGAFATKNNEMILLLEIKPKNVENKVANVGRRDLYEC